MILTAANCPYVGFCHTITGTRTYRALQTLTAQNNFVVASGGDVTCIAGQRIELKPGFTAQNGSQFQAQIDPNIGSQPGNVLSFTYNQAGERITKSSDVSGTLYYIRGVDGQTVALLSETDTPLFYNIADVGRLVPGSPAVSYYYLTDHLGSIRVIVDESGNVVSHTDYYPFGMAIPGRVMSNLSNDFYKYNAKQLDDDYGLNWHDYGWRAYDAEIGRFVKVDRFAEKYPSTSPYQFAANNPILFIDVNGDSAWAISGEWTEEMINKYRDYVSKRAKEYYENGTQCTCEDFALNLLIDFASENGLPLQIVTGSATFDAASDEFSNLEEFRNELLTSAGARDLQSESNTFLVSKETMRVGDIILFSNENGKASHTQVITTVTDKVAIIYQGNSGILNSVPGASRLLGAGNPSVLPPKK